MRLGRWAFPLPPQGDTAAEWGERIAWAAMQKSWVEESEELPITPRTHPDLVHSFILRHPGLFETCGVYPSLLVEYAPQLSIIGFEGELAPAIEEGYQQALAKKDIEDEWSLRHFQRSALDPSTVAYAYFHGGMFGPHTSPYKEFDHLVWVYSADSNWLPPAVKSCFMQGLIDYPLWAKYVAERLSDDDPCKSVCWGDVHSEESTCLPTSAPQIKNELLEAIKNSIRELGLKDRPANVLARMVKHDIVTLSFRAEQEMKARRMGKKLGAE